MTKAFISYHHENDQEYKHHLSRLAADYDIFEDCSLPVSGIPDDGRTSQSIRRQIRDEFLRDSEVTILLCGHETKGRKYVDWELKSSMINGRLNGRSGILVINLPGVSDGRWTAALPNEKQVIYPHYGGGWTSYTHRSRYEAKYPFMPDRIVDNLLKPDVAISVVPWDRVADNPHRLRWLVEATARAGRDNPYDLSREMRRNNSARNHLYHSNIPAGLPRGNALGVVPSGPADLMEPQSPGRNVLVEFAAATLPRGAGLADPLEPQPPGRNALLTGLGAISGHEQTGKYERPSVNALCRYSAFGLDQG